MTYDDFCRCNVEEFNAIYKAWRESKEVDERGAWERMRLLATIIIQPHVKRKIKPQTLLPLPWDNNKQANGSRNEAELTMEQKKERFVTLIHDSISC